MPSVEPGGLVSVPWLEGKNFVIGKVLAGGMGTVYQLVPTDPAGSTLALKTFQASMDEQQFRQECEVWISLSSHRFVAKAVAYGDFHGSPCVAARWYPYSLAQRPLCGWPGDRIQDLLRSLLQVLQFMSGTHNVVHQDIKPANILLDTNLSPALADFGLARLVRTEHLGSPMRGSKATLSVHGIGGTPFFMAPELLAGTGTPSLSTDMFSLGVTLFESLAGTHPYLTPTGQVLSRPHMEALADALAGHGRFGSHLHRCIGQMVQLDPGQRPSSYSQLLMDLELDAISSDTLREDSHTAVVALAMMLRRQGRYEEAVRELGNALDRDPQSPVLLNAQGTLAVVMGKTALALKAFEEAVHILSASNGLYGTLLPYCDPGANLGWQHICARRFEDAHACLSEVLRWLEKNGVPRLAAHYPEMGWLFLYRGDFVAACRSLMETARHSQLNNVAVQWMALAACLGRPPSGVFEALTGALGNLRPLDRGLAMTACLVAAYAPSAASAELTRMAGEDAGGEFSEMEKQLGLRRGSLRVPLTREARQNLLDVLDQHCTGGRHRGLS